MQNVAHHAIDVDVGENWSFDGALPDSAADWEPFAIAPLRSDLAPSIGVEVPEEFDVRLREASSSKGPP